MQRINGPDKPRSRRLRLDRDFAHRDYSHFSLYFKERAGYPWSDDGWVLRLDLTTELCPPLQCARLVFIQIWRPSFFRETWMGSNGHWLFSSRLTCPSYLEEFRLCANSSWAYVVPVCPSMHILILPYSLLYLPSMTSIRYLLSIFQQSPPLALMATKTPKFFSPPLTSMSKKRHAPPELLQEF